MNSVTESYPPPAADDFSPAELRELDRRTKEIGRDLFSSLDRDRPWMFQRKYWDNKIMDWSMRDERLKVQLFRFVDVLPMLNTDQLVAKRLGEYLAQADRALGVTSRGGLKLMKSTGMSRWMLAQIAKMGANDFARKFIAGTTAKEVIKAAQLERKQQRAFTIDVLGEAVTSDLEATRYFEEYVNLLNDIAPTVNSWPDDPLIDRDAWGEIPRVNLSVKLSALDCHFNPIDREGVTRRVGERLRYLLRIAKQNRAFINIDMESYDKKDLTLHIFKTILMEDEFRDLTDVGIVLQCYLVDSGRDFVSLRDWARKRGAPIWVRLVKGAYWDYETVHAQALGWPIPVYQQKWQSDANFERQVRFVMRNVEYLRPAIGSHNLRSIAHGIAAAEAVGVEQNAYEIQMLYGMADAEKIGLTRRGYRVRVYMPYGELIPGMAYLVRRLLENTSNDSFLRAGLQKGVDVEKLLVDPASLAAPERTAEPATGVETPGEPPSTSIPRETAASVNGDPDSGHFDDSDHGREEIASESPVGDARSSEGKSS